MLLVACLTGRITQRRRSGGAPLGLPPWNRPFTEGLRRTTFGVCRTRHVNALVSGDTG